MFSTVVFLPPGDAAEASAVCSVFRGHCEHLRVTAFKGLCKRGSSTSSQILFQSELLCLILLVCMLCVVSRPELLHEPDRSVPYRRLERSHRTPSPETLPYSTSILWYIPRKLMILHELSPYCRALLTLSCHNTTVSLLKLASHNRQATVQGTSICTGQQIHFSPLPWFCWRNHAATDVLKERQGLF